MVIVDGILDGTGLSGKAAFLDERRDAQIGLRKGDETFHLDLP